MSRKGIKPPPPPSAFFSPGDPVLKWIAVAYVWRNKTHFQFQFKTSSAISITCATTTTTIRIENICCSRQWNTIAFDNPDLFGHSLPPSLSPSPVHANCKFYRFNAHDQWTVTSATIGIEFQLDRTNTTAEWKWTRNGLEEGSTPTDQLTHRTTRGDILWQP